MQLNLGLSELLTYLMKSQFSFLDIDIKKANLNNYRNVFNFPFVTQVAYYISNLVNTVFCTISIFINILILMLHSYAEMPGYENYYKYIYQSQSYGNNRMTS